MSTIPSAANDPQRHNAWLAAIKHAFAQPHFLAAVVVLGMAALSLGAATQYLRLYFKKEPVPIARPLERIPPALGPWIQVSIDQPLDPEMQDVLGTKQYVFRDYVDSRLLGAKELADFKDKTMRERGDLLAAVQERSPQAVIRAAVTYYTGMVDTVAHIPDRCYVADNYEPESKEFPTWTMADKTGKPFQTKVSLIHFEEASPGHVAVTRNVAYFFHCNGEYEYDPIRGVRIRLQNLAERHAYYAKVEVMTAMRDRALSDRVMQDFLRHAMPEIEKCMPDWQQVKAGTYKPAPVRAAKEPL